MKIDTQTLTVEKIGFENEEKKFTINASAEAFKLLSSKIYANPIRGIIRELSVNSYDSHVAANNLDTAFKVNLPNQLCPRFRIRDFGTGLSKYDLENLYTTYCYSNKTHSNQYVGALGIGSKSPFSYTDSFSVISYFNGIKLTYNAFISSDGCPSLILLEETVSDEANGLEISFAVQRNDFDKFSREAKFVFSLFSPPPVITGNRITLDEFKPDFQGKDWYLGGNITENYAVMGNVVYNLNYSSLEDTEYSSVYYKVLQNSRVILWFDIGDLDITASREELSYSKKTIKNVKDKIRKVSDEIKDRLENDIKKNATNYFEACTYYAESAHLYRIFNLDNLTFNKKKIYNTIPLRDDNWKDLIAGLSIKKATKRRTKVILENYTEIYLPAEFYINDTKGGITRLRSHYLNRLKKEKNIYLLEFDPATTARQEFLDYLEVGPEIFNLTSSLPAPPKVARTPSKTVQAYQWQSRDWSAAQIDLTNTTDIFSFIKLFRFEITDDKLGKIGKYDFRQLVESLNALNIDYPTIAGLRQNVYNKVKALPNWKCFSEIVNELFDKYIADEKLEQILPHLIINDKRYYNLLEEHYKKLKKDVLCPKMQEIFTLIDSIEKYQDQKSSILRIHSFLQREKPLHVASVNSLFDELISESYPMVEFVKDGNFYWEKEIEHVKRIIHYINTTYKQNCENAKGAKC